MLSWKAWYRQPARARTASHGEAVRSRIDLAQDTPPVRLPLTENATPGSPGAADITPELISAVVDDFYASCRRDPVLGPIFERQVQDWDGHLARISAFWSAALLRTGGYSGRPLEAHLEIPGLDPGHFSTWLRLFRETLSRRCTPEVGAAFLTLAGRMANAIISRAELTKRPKA